MRNVTLLQADANQPPLRNADAVLLDAPCTGTGTFRRHPDARWRLSPADIPALAAMQRAFLAAAAPSLGLVDCSSTPRARWSPRRTIPRSRHFSRSIPISTGAAARGRRTGRRVGRGKAACPAATSWCRRRVRRATAQSGRAALGGATRTVAHRPAVRTDGRGGLCRRVGDRRAFCVAERPHTRQRANAVTRGALA